MKQQTKGTIKEGEYHPSADSAMEWLRTVPLKERLKCQEEFASTALSGNRLGEMEFRSEEEEK